MVLLVLDDPFDRGYQLWCQFDIWVDPGGVLFDVGHHFIFGLAAGCPIAVDANVSAGVGLGHGVLLTHSPL